MRLLSITCLLFTLLFLDTLTPCFAQSPEQLFQKGLIKEEGEGSLNEAIDIYNKIVKNQETDKSLRAKALLHVGACYEKLGKKEAAKVYQQLISNFPGQKSEVTIARERLARLKQITEQISKTPLIPKFTKIKIPTKLSWSVALSPDGKDLALVSEDKKLWIMPLSGNLGPEYSGAPAQINIEGIEVEWTGLSWSRDSKWIAFNEYPNTTDSLGLQGIYIVPSKGGSAKKIIENYRDVRTVNYRISLSPDGKNLAFSSVEDNKQHVYTIPVEGNEPKKIINDLSREPVYSPDGKWIAYVEDKNLGRSGGNLWIASEDGTSSFLVAKTENASSPVWSPDSKMIAFLDYSKDKKIFLVPVNLTEQSAGKITAIDVPDAITEISLIAGWTPDNRIGLLSVTGPEFALYTLPSDGGLATMILHDTRAFQPRWSKDGKQIYYSVPPKEGNDRLYRHRIGFVSANGGNGKLFPYFTNKNGDTLRTLTYQGGNRLHPNGKIFLASAWTTKDKNLFNPNFPKLKIWEIPLDGSKPVQITHKEGNYADVCPTWSKDGEKIAFIRLLITKGGGESYDRAGIFITDTLGNEQEILSSTSDKYIMSLEWSPDGKLIAYFAKDRKPPNKSYLNVFNIENGKNRVVGEVQSVYVNTELSWSPDSKRIAFNGEKDDEIKIMTLKNGTIENVSTGLKDIKIYHFDWSPDGKKFVFAGYKGGEKGFWFMENFLPLEKLTQNREVKTTKEQKGIRIKQISKASYLDDLGTVSSDGRWLSCVDWGEGNLAIRDLKTGQKRLLTNQATLEENPQKFVIGSAISKNGKLVAYSWFRPYHTFDLHIFDVEKNSSRLIYKEEGVEAYPVTWLSDAELIVIRQDRNVEKTYLTALNVNDSSFRDLKIFDQRTWFRLCTSPDEKYIAYNTSDSNAGNANIHLLSADGKSEFPLVVHPANDKVIGWVPGRSDFLFISDRSGTWDLWSAEFRDGKLIGDAQRVYTEIGEVDPIGMTNDGACYFGFSRRNFNTYIVPFNEQTGAIRQDEGKTLLGSNLLVDWSPDGNSIAYIKEDKSWSLIVADINSDSERQLAKELSMVVAPKWSPDGKTIFVFGRDKDKMKTKGYKGGFYTVDVKTGKAKEVCLLTDFDFKPSEDDALPVSGHEWSRDGKSIYFLFQKDRIFKYDLATGKEDIICRRPGFGYSIFDISPDRKKLLFAASDPKEEKSRLYTIPVDGGDAKEICQIQSVNYSTTAFWDKVGKYIYFTETGDGTGLWRVSAEGGTPEKVWQTDKDAEMFSIHPSGKQIAFSVKERTTQVKVIEGLKQELDKIYSQNE